MVDRYTHVNRHSVAGAATLIMGGPENFIGALRTWLHRLPTDPKALDQAAGILAACNPEIDLAKLRSSLAVVVLLRRLNLIIPRNDSTMLALTQKGRDILGANSSIE